MWSILLAVVTGQVYKDRGLRMCGAFGPVKPPHAHSSYCTFGGYLIPITMSLLVLSVQDVDRVISGLQSNDLETLMTSVFHWLSSSSDHASPHRTSISMARHTALFMPSRVPDLGTTIKVVSIPSFQGAQQGLPASTLVLDEVTGCVKAIVNATALTALRTAAGAIRFPLHKWTSEISSD